MSYYSAVKYIHPMEALGKICEKCNRYLTTRELQDGKCHKCDLKPPQETTEWPQNPTELHSF